MIKRLASYADITRYPRRRVGLISAVYAAFLLAQSVLLGATAGPLIAAGDLTLRHDIELLADAGVITGPISTWPLAWGPILQDVRSANTSGLTLSALHALGRVRERAQWETRSNELLLSARTAVAVNPTRIRSFQYTPRGEGEVSLAAAATFSWAALDLNLQYVGGDGDSQRVRFDDSYAALVLGNWSLGLSTQQRWWGPAWDGSLILSNSARPFPAITIDRVFTDPFDVRWLRWIGPWDLSVMFGQLESDRDVSNPLFFAARATFRPHRTLEIGISRSAMWCGDGRPCSAGTFVDLLLGQDNVGDEGINEDNEPGNQLGGFDVRWTPPVLGRSVSLYGQFIGEDEAGGLPSQYLGQVGAEWSGTVAERWSTRLFGEYSRTSCDFFGASDFFANGGFNCAYNSGVFPTGYRFRGRSIGHGADNDADLITVGAILVNKEQTRWQAHVRSGQLNANGPPDSRNTLTPTPQDLLSVDVSHSRRFRYGTFEIGAGIDFIDDEVSGETTQEGRFFLHFRTGF
ncbi:MAG: capsule assembly Wzi family protein [Pseudomonadota bacterium]